MNPGRSCASTDDAHAVRFSEAADAIVERIAPILANRNVELQGAVVADLAAIWLAGHRTTEGRAEGNKMREELLALLAEHVRELVEMYLDGVDG